MNILLVGNFTPDEQRDWAIALAQALPGHQLLTQRGQVADVAIDAAVVANPPPGSLQGLPRLRLIQSLWAGVDRLLADTSLPADVPIARMVDPAMNQAMAETALWATLALHRGYFTYARQQAASHWQPLPQCRADEVPVLLLGCGQMGQAAAAALQRQGYPVRAWRRGAAPAAAPQPVHAPEADPAAAPGASPGASPGVSPFLPAAEAGAPPWPVLTGDAALWAALPQTRVLINLLPLTPATRGLINQRLLQALPPGAGLVNLARGAHVVDTDLLAALHSGQIGHAVLDVFNTEPLPFEHPYWTHPQVTVLPHAAAATDVRSAAGIAARNLLALASGAPLVHLVVREAGY